MSNMRVLTSGLVRMPVQVEVPSTLVGALLETALVHRITLGAARHKERCTNEQGSKGAHGANVPDAPLSDQRIKRNASPSKRPRSLSFR